MASKSARCCDLSSRRSSQYRCRFVDRNGSCRAERNADRDNFVSGVACQALSEIVSRLFLEDPFSLADHRRS
jgi:hypothetical protein